MSADVEPFPDGTYLVAGADRLETLTAGGCKLVRLMSGSGAIQFLLMKSRDQTHADLAESLRESQNESRVANIERYAAARKLSAADRKDKDQKELLETMRKGSAAKSETIDELQEQMLGLENRLGAIRDMMGDALRHFGHKAWEEFLATRVEDSNAD